MEALGIAMVGMGVFFIYASINDIDPWATLKQSLATGTPTSVHYG